jgi:hypothetical protein
MKLSHSLVYVTLGAAFVFASALAGLTHVEEEKQASYLAGWGDGNITGLAAGEVLGVQKGKEAKMVELANLFAPYGYHKIRMAKKDCEVKTGMICKIYGGFAPDIKAAREEPVNKKGPL